MNKIQEHVGNDKSCVWHAPDFSDGELKEEMSDRLYLGGTLRGCKGRARGLQSMGQSVHIFDLDGMIIYWMQEILVGSLVRKSISTGKNFCITKLGKQSAKEMSEQSKDAHAGGGVARAAAAASEEEPARAEVEELAVPKAEVEKLVQEKSLDLQSGVCPLQDRHHHERCLRPQAPSSRGGPSMDSGVSVY